MAAEQPAGSPAGFAAAATTSAAMRQLMERVIICFGHVYASLTDADATAVAESSALTGQTNTLPAKAALMQQFFMAHLAPLLCRWVVMVYCRGYQDSCRTINAAPP
jgi:hypothetical protein